MEKGVGAVWEEITKSPTSSTTALDRKSVMMLFHCFCIKCS
jgi:hypothetical protein